MQRRIGLVMVLGLIVSLAGGPACRGGGDASPGVSDTEIKIGVSTPLTGGVAADGADTKKAVDLYVEQVNNAGGINGRKLRVVYEDDAYDATKGVAAIRKLIEQDQVFAIVGPGGTPPALPSIPIVQEAKVPMLIALTLSDIVASPHRRYVFQGNMTSFCESRLLVEYLVKELKPKKVAFLAPKGEYGENFVKQVTDALKEKGLTPVAAESAPIGGTDYSAQLLRLKSAEPDVIIWGLLGRDAGISIRQAREMGIKTPIWGTSVLNMVAVGSAAGEAIDGATFVSGVGGSPDEPKGKFKEFMDAFTKKYPDVKPKDMGTASFMPYATIALVGEALRKTGKDLTREKFIDTLESIKDFDPGATVPLSVDAKDHRTMKSAYLYRYDKSGRRLLVAGPVKMEDQPMKFEEPAKK